MCLTYRQLADSHSLAVTQLTFLPQHPVRHLSHTALADLPCRPVQHRRCTSHCCLGQASVLYNQVSAVCVSQAPPLNISSQAPHAYPRGAGDCPTIVQLMP